VEAIRRASQGQVLALAVSYSLRYDKNSSQLTPTQNLGLFKSIVSPHFRQNLRYIHSDTDFKKMQTSLNLSLPRVLHVYRVYIACISRVHESMYMATTQDSWQTQESLPLNYIPTHLHLSSNTHMYTPYAQRYCPLCLPLHIPGDETHALLHCPYFSPLTQPAIDNLMLNLRRFDLWSWATYTDTQKVDMLLGAIPPKLDRQHEKAWALLTFPACTRLICSLQSHTRLTQPFVPPVPSPLPTSSLVPP